MIPQLAHHPRNLSEQQFGEPDFTIPPFQSLALPLPRPRRPEPSAPLPVRSAREFASPNISTPSPRAYPLDGHVPRRTGLARESSSEQTLRSPYNDPAEHMLRRKTPNGTLAAGYDGTPVQWSSKAPALKHVVLPLSGSSSGRELAHSPAISDRYSRIGPGWDHQTTPIHYGGLSPPGEQSGGGRDSGSLRRFPTIPGNAYSVWNDVTIPSNPTYYPKNVTRVPTVLQPAYQASPGPTASNDGGLYGPYWPDGKFVPYRPAAIQGQGGHNQETYLRGALPNDGYWPGFSPPFRPMSLAVGTTHRISGTPYHNSCPPQSAYLDTRYEIPPQLNPVLSNTNAYPSITDGSRTPAAESLNRASNYRFREKTLSWAHTIYVDLLAFLHQSKKESKLLNSSQGAKPYAKTSIYPKPPRQPATYLPASYWLELGSHGTESNTARSSLGGRLGSTSIQTSARENDGWSPYGARGSAQTASPHELYGSPFQLSQYLRVPPTIKAKEALELLTNLCEQSGWNWIDGMLLGGCLAYGLEHYESALDWYSKIIALDSKHVEAISNLAATLLCLNRRSEAEEHWLQSVRLRPSYFEAVEHLIGLLCGNNRGEEAVNIIDFVQKSLRLPKSEDSHDQASETSSNTDREFCEYTGMSSESIALDYERDRDSTFRSPSTRDDEDLSQEPGFGSSGFSVPGSENGRILALVHAKGNMLYALGDIGAASRAFEDAVLISTGQNFPGVQGLIRQIINVLSREGMIGTAGPARSSLALETPLPLLLPPEKALQTARLVFTRNGELPGLRLVPEGLAKKAAISTTSNSLLSLAKIFQDAMSSSNSSPKIARMPSGIGDILALYYLSLSLQPSPSTANNVGILLASVQQPATVRTHAQRDVSALDALPGIVPGSGVALALAYYNYGLNLDSRHAHIYTNLGSLLKDIGHLDAAISMYEKAVACDSSFDIALANLANAVKDQGKTSDAIEYYRRAVAASPDFAEAVCGLANALNSVCDWAGRGGVILDRGKQDRWHVDEKGMLVEARMNGSGGGWMKSVVDIVTKQLKDGSVWGRGTLLGQVFEQLLRQLEIADTGGLWLPEKRTSIQIALGQWAGHNWEGSLIVRMIERSMKRAMHRWYQDKYVRKTSLPTSYYPRPLLPGSLSVPTAPTVLPFHTFTCPLSAKDIRRISQRNALRISCSTLRAPWMPRSVFPPPPPPAPHLNIGYISSDFNNHPLAHLMQSVFGFHDISRAKAFCYATTTSDHSIHRQQIEREAPVFHDASSWSADRLVHQIVSDEIHILVNLNGYTRGARNEVFAARPAPIQMSFMGFAGTLGAEWCDYLLADETAIPPETLRPWRRNLDLEDQLLGQQSEKEEGWVYSENIIFCRDTFFCCDHAQSELLEQRLTWEEEQRKRWQMRKELFPYLPDDAVILGNFNQLYKIEPTTFRTWLRILEQVPNAILWLLKFPELGESNLRRTAHEWAGESVASRIEFTEVAPKHLHISRARICDLFLDTPECNAHTTAADVLWSSTPILTLPRYKYKMCSRMAASILKGALPRSEEGRQAAKELIAKDDDQYEEFATKLAGSLIYQTLPSGEGQGVGRLAQLRRLLFDSRWTCALFDTKRWVTDLESAYEEAWRKWVSNEGGDIYL